MSEPPLYRPRGESLDRAATVAIGRVARAARLAHGWTLEEVAERGDLDVRSLQRIERGTGNPTVATVVRLSSALGVAPARLFAGSVDFRDAGAAVSPPFRTTPPPSPTTHLSSDALVAGRVHSLRLAREWSQHDLAARAGVSASAVQTLEAQRKSPTLRTLDAIARALEVAVHEILTPAIIVKTRARAGRR